MTESNNFFFIHYGDVTYQIFKHHLVVSMMKAKV